MKTEIKRGEPEQLTLKAFELAELTRELLATEDEKKEQMAEFNERIKALKRNIKKLAYEVQKPAQ